MTQNKIWDPFKDTSVEKRVEATSSSYMKKLEEFNKNPQLPQRRLFQLALPGIVCLGIFVFFPAFLTNFLQLSVDLSPFVVFLSFTPVMVYYAHIHSLERDLVKLLIANKNKWAYKPKESYNRWQKALLVFPDFFNKGTTHQNMQDEFWGKVQGINFYTGIFHYVIKRKSGNKKRTKTFHKTIFAIQLPKTLKSTFRLESPSLHSKIKNFFKKRTLRTESLEFNKHFTVFHNEKKDPQALNIIKTLSPVLIEKLIKLKEEEKNPEVYFKEDTVLFMFSGRLLPKMKTNFFRQVELDIRDQEFIENRINKILKISQEMIKYLD